MTKPTVLDLFSGIGGFSLGLHRAGMETVAFCEIEKYPQRVLKKNFPGVPIYDDVRKLTRERLTQDGIGPIELVCGGFPCQPFSQAGERRGFTDDRDLWPEMFRVIQEVRPRWVIGENVAGFVNMGLERTISNLESEAYEVQSFIVPACAINAPHRRDRIWIVAHSEKSDDREPAREVVAEGEIKRGWESAFRSEFVGCGEVVADSNATGRGERWGGEPIREKQLAIKRDSEKPGGHWEVEPDVGRVAHGIPARVDRLKGLGNAVVPHIPEIIGRVIMWIDGK